MTKIYTPIDDIQYISKTDVCRKLNVSATGLERMINRNEIQPVKLPYMRRIVFVESEVNDYQKHLNETSRGRAGFGAKAELH